MKVSVVIPAYNEERYIKKCLTSLTKQTQAPDEIILVNNNSKDKTVEIAKNFNVRIINEEKQGLSYARNRGFDEAKFEIIARTDSDTILPKNWIEKIKSNFENQKIDALTGPVAFYGLFNFPATPIPSRIYLESLRAISQGNRYLQGPNMILTKNIWLKVREKVNNNDKKVHEDVDISIKINSTNGIIGFDPDLIVQISSRRIKEKPESFFIEYPIKLVNTLIQDKVKIV